jgi:hypothetical protein
MTDHHLGPQHQAEPVWPSSPHAFADRSLCPRCFAVLTSTQCGNCGIQLAVPLAARLLEASESLVAAAAQRRELLDIIWSEQLARQLHEARQQMGGAPVSERTEPAVRSPSVTTATPVATATPIAPVMPLPDTQVVLPPRRSGVQVFLLVTGIVLVSVFALFFLTVAYLFATVETRVVVTGLGGLLVLGAAWLLARRRLPATAEGVGIAGAAILLGVLAFVRASELFGSGAVDAAVFCGAGLLVIAALLELVHRITALRFARIGSILLAPVGIVLVIVGASHPIDAGLAWWTGLVTAGTATLLVRRSVAVAAETQILRSIAFAAVCTALVPAGLLLPESPAVSGLAYSLCALAWGAFVLRLRSVPEARAWRLTASALLGLSVALAPSVAILRSSSVELTLWAPGIAAATVAVAFLAIARRSPVWLVRRTAGWAQAPALVVAAVALLPGIGLALAHIAMSLTTGYSLWQASPGDPVTVAPVLGAWAAVLAPGLAALLGALAIRLARLELVARGLVVSLACTALLAAASHGGTVLLVLAGYLLVAATCLTALLATRDRRVPVVRIPVAVTLGLSALAMVDLAHASSELWLPGVLLTVGIIVAARFSVTGGDETARVLRALFTVAAVGLLFATAALLMPWAAGWRATGPSDDAYRPVALDFAALPACLAALLLCATPLLLGASAGARRRGAVDLRAAALLALALLVPSAAIVFAAGSNSLAHDVARIGIPLLVAVAAVLWQLRTSVGKSVERAALSAFAPLAIAAALSATADAFVSTEYSSTNELGGYLAGPVAAIVSAVIALLLFREARAGLPAAARIAWESATAVVMIVAVVRSVATAGDHTWLTLLLLALAPVIIAFSDGNPFTAASARRHAVWVACGLAVCALWQFLGARHVTEVEPYTLPVAGLLLALAASIAVFGRVDATTNAGRNALLASGLAIALAPSVLVSTGAAPDRALVLLGAGVALTGTALVAPEKLRGLLLRAMALTAGLATLTSVGFVRAVREASLGYEVPVAPELWVIPAALCLVVCSLVWTRRRATPFRVAQLGVPVALTLVGLCVLMSLVTDPGVAATPRLIIASAVFGAITITAAVHGRVPLDHISARTAVSFLAAIGLLGLVVGAADPFELAIVPLSVTLLVCGLIRLRRDAAARTWPQLGPGIALLLLPSLLADFVGSELWRVIALGVVALAVVTVSIALRWQAPLVVGASVLIVHAIAQLWPWIQGLYSAVPWWIWLGVGGVLLIALAARYEHRVRNLRSFVGSIAALR